MGKFEAVEKAQQEKFPNEDSTGRQPLNVF